MILSFDKTHAKQVLTGKHFLNVGLLQVTFSGVWVSWVLLTVGSIQGPSGVGGMAASFLYTLSFYNKRLETKATRSLDSWAAVLAPLGLVTKGL